MKDQEFIDKVLEMADKKRSTDPLNQQFNKLLEDVYPYKKLLEFYYLGEAQMLKIIYEGLFKDNDILYKDSLDTYIKHCLDKETETVGKYLKELLGDK